MKVLRVWWVMVLLVLTVSPAGAVELAGKVVRITDGDTLRLLVDRREVKIRLAEIDTPERGQPYGSRAKEVLSELAFGKPARVAVVDRDRYGRTVGRVYVGNLDVNAELVRRGAAWVYRKYAKDPSLFALEAEARRAKRGLSGASRRQSECHRGSGGGDERDKSPENELGALLNQSLPDRVL